MKLSFEPWSGLRHIAPFWIQGGKMLLHDLDLHRSQINSLYR